MSYTLAQARQEFVKKTGRYDLVVDTTDWVDNGANFFLQSGQRYLDTVLPNPNSERGHRVDIDADDSYIELQYCRYVKSVEVFDAEGREAELTPVQMSQLQDGYSKAVSSQDSGTPAYFSWGLHLPSPEQEALTSGDYTGTFTFDVDTLSFAAARNRLVRIEFRPKADTIYTMKVLGGFWSVLDEDTDTSWHSLVYPELFILAGKLALSAFYDNSAGLKDALNSMQVWLRGQDHDMVRQEIANSLTRHNGKYRLQLRG